MFQTAKTNGRAVHELIAFRLSDQEFCVSVMSIREIRGWTPATPLPASPSFMRGVINLRGTVLPIVDLAARLGFPLMDPTARHAIIVAQIGAQVVGLLVDGVSDIFTVTDDQIQATPHVASESTKRFVRGVIPLDGRLISLLAIESLLPETNRSAA